MQIYYQPMTRLRALPGYSDSLAAQAKEVFRPDTEVQCNGIEEAYFEGSSPTEVDHHPHREHRILSGLVECGRDAQAMMDRGWGRTINRSSQVARTRAESANSYCAVSKAALISLSRGLALEIAGYDVTVNCIAPKTDRHAQDRRNGYRRRPSLCQSRSSRGCRRAAGYRSSRAISRFQ